MLLARPRLYLWGLMLMIGAAPPAHAAPISRQTGDAERCAALAGFDLGNDSRVTSARLIQPPFTVTPADAMMARMFPPRPTKSPFCRVEVTARPDQSEIRYEAWLPVTANWNGRFFGVGAGGFSGDILYSAPQTFAQGGLSGAMDAGYAAMATDYGHRSGSGDLMWAIGKPEQVADFGYRAVHVATVGAKRIATKFYGKPPKFAYWDGCSRGGAMGMVNAQRWYRDYNGIVAGNPAIDWIRSMTTATAYTLRQVRDPASRIPMTKRSFIHMAVLSQCDELDDLKDGIVSRPELCRVDTKRMICTSAEKDDCLTEGQASALHEMYTGIRRRNGDRLADAQTPGAEGAFPFLGATTFVPAGAPDRPDSVAQFWSAFVYEDPAFNPGKSLDLESAYDLAMKKLSWALSYQNPDLSAFKRAGGKIIFYHGAGDGLNPPTQNTEYYQELVRTMGQQSADEFVRYFTPPGFGHCFGGDGPDVFDMLKPLENWVEKGIAPAQVIASKYDETGKVVRTRPLCPFPQVARYDGKGSIDLASSFSCAVP